MTELFDFDKDRDKFPHYFLIAAISENDILKKHPEVITKGGGKNYEITFQINGVDLPFVKTLTDIWSRMENEYDVNVNKAVVNLIREKFGDIETLFSGIMNMISEQFNVEVDE